MTIIKSTLLHAHKCLLSYPHIHFIYTTLCSTASAPPQEEPKDINSYFYTEVRKRNPLPSGNNNSLVSDNATGMVLGGDGAIVNPPNSSYSLLGGTTAAAPDSQDPSLYSNGGDITKPVALPVPAQAVAVDHDVMVGTDVAVAEVYVGEN